jgi:TGF-beta propeptide
MPVQSFKVGEMLNKRTPNSKTWINFDGSYTTEIHQGIIHYEDATGNLHNINTDLFDEADFNEIDFPVAKDGDSLFYEQQAKATKDKKKNRLNRENYDFQGLAVPYECRIPRNIRRGYSIGKGASKLKFIPVGASVSKGYAEGNKITYPDVWNDADLILELLPEGIKETIILKTDKAPINFSFEVQGELAEELKIQPMWLMDAEGTKRDVLQGVSQVDDKVLLNIAADTSNLVYPIEVDPTVTIQPDGTTGIDSWVVAGSSTNNATNSSLLVGIDTVASYVHRSFLKFDLSTIPSGASVSNALLELYQQGQTNTNVRSMHVNEVLSNWDEFTINGTNQPSISSTISGSGNSLINGGWVSFYITSLLDSWIKGTKPNYGLVIKASDETNTNTLKYFTSSDSPTIANRPKLSITYNQPPTAPVVTAPNGGETWNSSHVVTWQGANDILDIGKASGSSSLRELNYGVYQIIKAQGNNIKSLTFRVRNESSSTLTYNITVKDTSGVGGKPNVVLSSQSFNVSPGFDGMKTFTFPVPLSVTKEQKYAIGLYAGNGNAYWYYSSNDYADGNVYLDQFNSFYNEYDQSLQVEFNVTDLQYQIQLSTNNGSTWKDIVALTAAGATSYAYDFINEAETSTALIRVRAYDGSAYGPWDTSNGVFTIVHNQAPTAPTGLSPSGEPKDRASVVRFGWLHNDPNAGDPQSKFDLQWRVQGSPTWNTVTQATTNNYYDMPAGTLPKSTIEWQVRTYDQAGLPSPYSALQVFIAGDKPPTPTITGPVNGSVVPVSKPVVQWSSVDQAAYQVNVLNASGSTTLWTTGQVNSGNKAVTVGIDLENNTDYRIQTLVRGAEGIWSNAAVSNINVSYTPPALPILTTSTDSEKGTITVQIDNPLPIGTEPTVLYNDLFRLEPGGLWERIATNIPADGFYTDYTVASGKNYQYKVVVLGDNETVRESGIISNSVSFKGIYLQVASDPLNTSYQFKNDSEGRSSKWNLNHTYHKFAGRNNLVIDTEDSSDYGVDFSLKLKTAEELTALERIIYSQEVVCYRDGRGRKVFGVFTGFPLEDATWGESTSLNLMKIDYKEEVL